MFDRNFVILKLSLQPLINFFDEFVGIHLVQGLILPMASQRATMRIQVNLDIEATTPT